MKEIELTKGAKTIVCDCHYDLVKNFKWHLTSGGYAGRKVMAVLCHCGCKGSRQVNMHRVINNTPEDLQTDHINRDRLDNRCSNLRSATVSENLTNRGGHGKSGYKFVHQSKYAAEHGWKSWMARYRENPKSSYIHLGNYATPEIAAEVVRQYIELGIIPNIARQKGKHKKGVQGNYNTYLPPKMP